MTDLLQRHASNPVQSVFVSALRGISDTRMPALISILSYWGVGVVSGYVLATPMGLGPIGVWIGMAIGLAAATLILGIRCWRTCNILIKQNRFDLI